MKNEKNNTRGFFINEKPVMALITVRRENSDIYCSEVSKKIDTTYAHTVRIISRLEEEGFIRSEKKGRKKMLYITEKGKEYADSFDEVIQKFSDNNF